MKFLGLLLPVIIATSIILVANAYAISTERNVRVNLDGEETMFSIITYDFTQAASIIVDQKFLNDIAVHFGRTSFVFLNQISVHGSGESFIMIEPKITIGDKLEVEFVAGSLTPPHDKSIPLSSKIDSPKKQMVNGVAAEDVVCRRTNIDAAWFRFCCMR